MIDNVDVVINDKFFSGKAIRDIVNEVDFTFA